MKAAPKQKRIAKSFKATLEYLDSSLGWVIARMPFDPRKVWGPLGRFRVRGEINGFAFRTSLFPSRKDYHFLLVNKRMQAGSGAGPGTVAQIRLELDTEKRVAVVPPELRRILAEVPSLRRWFEQLNYSTRKWIGDWVVRPKGAVARERRADQVSEQLLATMEAERELPPLLRLAFAREPRALQGWQRMTPAQRRGHLLAIFYYRSPDARERRIAKTIEDALAFAARKAKKEK
jgi:uncharacterized protein YdeI (YjbR/CyaY-like superfamily)